MVLTVSDVLELPVMKRGLPEVVSGQDHLGRPVRWAHVVDVAEVSGLLKGGEFVLNNGFGIGHDARAQRGFIRELAEQEVSAVAVELGLLFQKSLPRPMSAEADRLGVPLIALHRKTRFVEVTEAVHQRLMGDELVQLRRTDDLTRQLTDSILAGAEVPAILDEAARLLGNPIVLEDASRRLVAVASGQSSEEIVLRAWQDLHESEAREHEEESRGAVEQPIRLIEGPRGRLVCLELDGPLDELGEPLLERVAAAVALRLVTQRQVEELSARSRGALLGELLASRVGEQEAARRAEGLAFARRSRTLLALALAWRHPDRDSHDSWVALISELRAALRRSGRPALIGPYGDRLLLLVDPMHDGRDTEAIEQVVAAIREGAERHQLSEDDFAISVGPVAETWMEAGVALDRAARHVLVATTEEPAPWHDARRVGLSDVLSEMGASPTLRAFLHDRLGPLAGDVTDRRQAELLRTLEAYLSHGGRKTAAAKALHLERQSLYHRLDRLRELLGVNWDDGDELLELHLALRARQLYREDDSSS